tara:strand:- start:336 stop:590 length:255 start_codon:yes stop_codon:yes gene_type:complete
MTTDSDKAPIDGFPTLRAKLCTRRLARFVAFVAVGVLSSSLAWADIGSARRAAQQGDQARAYRELVPLAEAGNIDAQYYLGGLY